MECIDNTYSQTGVTFERLFSINQQPHKHAPVRTPVLDSYVLNPAKQHCHKDQGHLSHLLMLQQRRILEELPENVLIRAPSDVKNFKYAKSFKIYNIFYRPTGFVNGCFTNTDETNSLIKQAGCTG